MLTPQVLTPDPPDAVRLHKYGEDLWGELQARVHAHRRADVDVEQACDNGVESGPAEREA